MKREARARLRRKFAHLYAPSALVRLRDRDKPGKEPPARVSLPRGATLPKGPATVPAFVHSAYKPPRKMTGRELARALREQHGPWPLA